MSDARLATDITNHEDKLAVGFKQIAEERASVAQAIANANIGAKLPLSPQHAANARAGGIALAIVPCNVAHPSHITQEVVSARLLNNLGPQGLIAEATHAITQTVLTLLQENLLRLPPPQQSAQPQQQQPAQHVFGPTSTNSTTTDFGSTAGGVCHRTGNPGRTKQITKGRRRNDQIP